MKIPIVNEQDEIIGYKKREQTTRDDIRRIVFLFVFNENKDFLIARRQSNKVIDPNCWGPSVAGTIDEGFNYDETVIKETEEELGLKNIKPIFLKKYFYETHNARRFSSVYYVFVNSKEVNFKIQDEEVSEIRWISFKELEKWFKNKPEDFVPFFQNVIYNIKEIYENKK